MPSASRSSIATASPGLAFSRPARRLAARSSNPLAGKNDGKILPLDVRDPSHDGLLVADLALRHLAGAADRKPFAHRHRTGAGNQSRSSCKENRAFFHGGASHAPDQDRKSVV